MNHRKFLALCRDAAYRANAYGERERQREAANGFWLAMATEIGYEAGLP